MASIHSVSIDVTKIDKTKLITGKTGGKYLNIDVIINDELNKFGQNVSVSISQSKEERDGKAAKTYIGNGKTVWSSDNSHPRAERQPTVNTQQPGKPQQQPQDDDLPF